MGKLIKPIGTRRGQAVSPVVTSAEPEEKTEWEKFHNEAAQALELRLKDLARPLCASKTRWFQHGEGLWQSDAQS